jgi:hypothetical protein
MAVARAETDLKRAFLTDPLHHLSHIDAIHDFKTFLGKDGATKKRNDERYHYWDGFKHYILAMGSGQSPSFAATFNNCVRSVSAAEIENTSLKFAKDLTKPVEHKVVYKGGGRTPNQFYTDVAEHLAAYAVGGQIPLVVDTEYTLNSDGPKLREFSSNFVVCKNKENFSDPGRSYMRGYGSEASEEGAERRTYNGGDVDTGIGDVTLSGSAGDVTIEYGGIITENYRRLDVVLPNSKGQCQGVFESLLKTFSYTNDELLDYCGMFNTNTPFPDYATTVLLRRIAVQFIKKRLGDQLQVASCKKRIHYKLKLGGALVYYGGAANMCVFWSYDRVAIAYAILIGVPCVLQEKNGNVTIFIPRVAIGGAQKGGAPCTRSLVHTEAQVNANSSSTPIARHINSSPDCLNRYLEMHFEPDSVYYQPINCIMAIKFLINSTAALMGLRVRINAMLSETFLNTYSNTTPQLYIAGANEADDTAALAADPNLVFYSKKYLFYIERTNPMAGRHEFTFRRTGAGGAVPGADADKIITFSGLIPEISGNILRGENEPLENQGGGGSSVKNKANPLIHLLSCLSSVEKKLLILSDNRELFFAEDKGCDVPYGGYSCYDMIFFIQVLVETFKTKRDKNLVIDSVGSLFQILEKLGEDKLVENLKFFLNTYSPYKHKHGKTINMKHIQLIALVVEESKKRVTKTEKAMASFDFDSDKMTKYLDDHLPIGIITRFYNEAYLADTPALKRINLSSLLSQTKKNLKKRSRSLSANRAISRSNNRRSTTYRNNTVLRTPSVRTFLGF